MHVYLLTTSNIVKISLLAPDRPVTRQRRGALSQQQGVHALELTLISQNNTSLAGVLRTVSKLILVAVMIRGRHRGLPAAIDRSVMLPHDLRELADDVSEALVDESERIEMRRRSTERYERTETLRTV